jgi:hypothetical protein
MPSLLTLAAIAGAIIVTWLFAGALLVAHDADREERIGS